MSIAKVDGGFWVRAPLMGGDSFLARKEGVLGRLAGADRAEVGPGPVAATVCDYRRRS